MSGAVGQVPVQSPADPNKMAFLGVRILKAPDVGRLDWQVELPRQCARCQLVQNDYAAGQNAKEIFFHVWVPAGQRAIGPFRVTIAPSKVRGVLVSYTDTVMAKRGWVSDRARAVGPTSVKFHASAGTIAFDIPAKLQGVSVPPDDLGEVSQYYTYIETPGVYIRISHADPERRAGPYATGPWPTKQAAAAINLEFAAREAISALQLAKALPRLGVSTIMLMNFDTNYPTLDADRAHDDWPPHWHMHLFWEGVPRVRKVAHFYLSENALLTSNLSEDSQGNSLTHRLKSWFPNGVADETRTPTGDLVYSQTVTPEGFFKLRTSAGTCLIRPAGRGFDSGAVVNCDNGTKPVSVHAYDDPAGGVLTLFRDSRPDTEYRYDADTGGLASTRSLNK